MSNPSGKIFGLRALLKFDNRFQLLINRLFFPNVGPTIYLIDGLEVLVDHSTDDQNGTRSCLVPGLYDPCFEALADLPESLSVLDLGGNGGGFLLALKRAKKKIRRAVVVELNPHTHSRLTLNLLRNIPECHERVTILNGAAGGNDGQLTVKLGRGSVVDSVTSPASTGEEFSLPCHSFRSLAAHFPQDEDIDICKIDIEGAEYELLGNTLPELLRRCRHIIIEIHEMPGENSADLLARITSAGFKRIEPPRPLPETTVYLFSRVPDL